MLLTRIRARRDELIQRAPTQPPTRKDFDAFNVLLAAARRERISDPLVRCLPAIAPDQLPTRAALVDAYDRLALALGEMAELAP